MPLDPQQELEYLRLKKKKALATQANVAHETVNNRHEEKGLGKAAALSAGLLTGPLYAAGALRDVPQVIVKGLAAIPALAGYDKPYKYIEKAFDENPLPGTPSSSTLRQGAASLDNTIHRPGYQSPFTYEPKGSAEKILYATGVGTTASPVAPLAGAMGGFASEAGGEAFKGTKLEVPARILGGLAGGFTGRPGGPVQRAATRAGEKVAAGAAKADMPAQPLKQTPAASVEDATGQIGNIVRGESEALNTRVQDAFRPLIAPQRGTSVTSEIAKTSWLPEIKHELEVAAFHPSDKPYTARIVKRIGETLNNPEREPNLRELEGIRQQMVDLIDQGTDPIKGMSKDAVLLNRIKGTYDNYLTFLTDKGLFDGDDAILTQLKNARSLRTEQGRRFDDSEIVRRITSKQGLTAEELLNATLGSNQAVNKASSGRIFDEVLSAAGERAGEVKELYKSAILHKFLRDAPDATGNGLDARKLQRAINLFIKQNPTLATKAFSPQDIRALRSMAAKGNIQALADTFGNHFAAAAGAGVGGTLGGIPGAVAGYGALAGGRQLVNKGIAKSLETTVQDILTGATEATNRPVGLLEKAGAALGRGISKSNQSGATPVKTVGALGLGSGAAGTYLNQPEGTDTEVSPEPQRNPNAVRVDIGKQPNLNAIEPAAGKTPAPTSAVSPTFIDAIIGTESGGRVNAKATTSRAQGQGQFIPRTWLAMIRKHRPDIARGKTPEQILKLRTDPNLGPALNREMIEKYAEENAGVFERGGVPVTDVTLKLAHFLGAQDARKLLSAKVGTPVARIVSGDAIRANPAVLKGKKAEDVLYWAQAQMDRHTPR